MSTPSQEVPHIPTRLTEQVGIRIPVICGPMYPCSNPELVAAVSRAGGIGVVQPVSLTWVHKHDFREGLRLIRSITPEPIGVNALIEKSSERYRQRLEQWVEIALEEGVRFFVTSLGNPRWVVDRVSPAGGIVYHDVTERKWAQKGVDGGVHGLIAVNRNAGGHAGARDPRALLDEVADLGLPVVCAGGIGDAPQFVDALRMGYAGAQLGTRFIATPECLAHPDYKAAIVRARAEDVVLTERLTGVPVAVLKNPYIERIGTRAGPLARALLRHPRAKHWMRMAYTLRSAWSLRKSLNQSEGDRDYWQAGRSVEHIDRVEPAGTIVARLAHAAAEAGLGA
ncbi:MAG: nitronate monooxygenase [Gemmatimonadaceae bacterium]|nr:nitronate monooxygenase [Gemmatimonadaceae bacterium]